MKYMQMMIKPASSNCNLRCSYCFYEDECKNREIPSYGIMKEDTMEILVKKKQKISAPLDFRAVSLHLQDWNFLRNLWNVLKNIKKKKQK